MANNKTPTDKPEPDDSALDSGSPGSNKPDLDAPVKPGHKTRNVPTMMEPVMEAPENIDLDLLDVPILTKKVEQSTNDPANPSNPATQGDQQPDHEKQDQ